jgi:hypothetical protein
MAASPTTNGYSWEKQPSWTFQTCFGGNLRYVLTASWAYRSYQTIIRVRSKGWLLLPLLTVSPVGCQCVMTGSAACSNWVSACQNCFQLMVISVKVSVVVISSLMHMWYVPTSPWFFLLLLPAAHVQMVIFYMILNYMHGFCLIMSHFFFWMISSWIYLSNIAIFYSPFVPTILYSSDN